MAKSELTNEQHNEKAFKEIRALELKIEEIKKGLFPVEMKKQASLNECNALARKAKITPSKINPKLVAEESGIK